MAKLVVLSEGMTGQSYELKVDKTTVGRLEDNTFQVPHPSVSSHHCEIQLRGSEVVIKDLNSTNGTFINNQQVTSEGVLKPHQILRLGQIEMRLETPDAPPPPGTTPAASSRKPVESTMVVTRGVSMDQLGQTPSFDTTSHIFAKKKNSTNKWFLIGGVVLLVIIVTAFLVILSQLNSKGPGH